MTDPATDPEPTDGPGYATAMAELETILRELEDGEVDIDRLANQVRRAAELVRLCQGRLAAARTEVTRIVAELDGTSGSDGPGAEPSATDSDADTDPGPA